MNERLTLQDLVDILAEKQNISKKNSELFLRELFGLITETISSKDYVRIKDFGTFKLVAVSSRKSVDVNTGEPIEIPPHYKLSFSPEKSFREQINSPFAHIQSVLLDDNEEDQDTLKVTEKSVDSKEVVVTPDINNKDSIQEVPVMEEIPELDEISNEINDSDIEGIDLGDSSDNDILVSDIEIADVSNSISEDIETVQDEKDEEVDTTLQEDEDIADFLKESKSGKSRGLIIGICAAVVVLVAIGFFLMKKSNTPETIVAEVETQKVESVENENDSMEVDDEEVVQVEDSGKETPAQAEKTDKPAAKPEKGTESKIIKLASGESLQVLARKHFGNSIFWIYIYKENSDVIKKPDAIFAGMDLKIPSAAKYNIDAKDPKSIERAKQEVTNLENGAKVAEPVKQVEQPKTTNKATTVKLQKGETLQTLAKKHLGDKIFWVYIFEENSDVIKNPDAIFADMELKIPTASKYKADAKDPKSIERATQLQREIFKKYAK